MPIICPKSWSSNRKMVLALTETPTQSLRVVVEDGARDAALEAAARSMIEFMHRSFELCLPVEGHSRDIAPALGQMLLEIADVLFHVSVLTWKIRGNGSA